MPRTEKATAQEREDFMLQLFKTNPDMTVHQANDKLAEKFDGKKMRLQKCYDLRATARTMKGLPPRKERHRFKTKNGVTVPKTSPGVPNNLTAAGRRPNKRPLHASRPAQAIRTRNPEPLPAPPQHQIVNTEGSQKVVMITGKADQVEFFLSTLEILRHADVAAVNVDHRGPDYAVVRRA